MTEQIVNHVIRKAKFSDVSGMIGLLRILFYIETAFSFEERTQQSGLEMMLDDCNARCIMVAEQKQQIIGMCTAQLLVSTAKGGIVALVEDMVVEDTHRGEGIGRDLLLAVEEWAIARGVRRLQLLADQKNIPALEFYKKMDWESTQLICLQKNRQFL